MANTETLFTIRRPELGFNSMGQFTLEFELEGPQWSTGFQAGFPPESGALAELLYKLLKLTGKNLVSQLEGAKVRCSIPDLVVSRFGSPDGRTWIDLKELYGRHSRQ